MLLTNRINAINDQIAAYLEQIAELQTRVTDLQGHAQEVQGVEQAAESALNQIEAAINMLQVVCPEEIATFKAAIDSKFNQLPQLAGGDDTPTPTSNPTNPPNEPEIVEAIAEAIVDEPFIEIVAVPTATKEAHDETTTEDDTSNGNGYHHALTYDELSTCDAAMLVKLCALKGIPVKNPKAKSAKAVKNMAALLGGIVSQEDLDALNNS